VIHLYLARSNGYDITQNLDNFSLVGLIGLYIEDENPVMIKFHVVYVEYLRSNYI